MMRGGFVFGLRMCEADWNGDPDWRLVCESQAKD